MNISSQRKDEENISVIIRIKPDDTQQRHASIQVSNSNSISLLSEKKEYFYDYIGDENSTQNDIFQHCGKKICDYALEGYNCTKNNNNTSAFFNNNNEDIEMNELNNNISFYYNNDDEKIGLLQRILYYLFQNKEKSEKDENNKYIFRISYIEIYKEDIKDLLSPNNKETIKLSDVNGVLTLQKLRTLIISSIL